MNSHKYLFLFLLTVGVLLTGTRGHTAQVDFERKAAQPAVSSSNVQLVGSTHFSFGFGIESHHGHGYPFGYKRYHHGRHYNHRYNRYGYYYRYPYRYKYYFRPYYRDHRYRGGYYRYRYRDY